MTGKGLAFLNKKSWHTSTLKNQERVWKREQEAKAGKKAGSARRLRITHTARLEAKKIEQWKREKLEEAKINDLRNMHAGKFVSATC